jgi:uncharacterized membrane protein YqjE
MTAAEELDPLRPTALEITLAAVGAVHLVLLTLLIVLVVLDRVRVPRGAIWIVILLVVPVAGPAMVLYRGRRSPEDRAAD